MYWNLGWAPNKNTYGEVGIFIWRCIVTTIGTILHEDSLVFTAA